jgi:N-acetylmuramoyl-L-alanine amidase
MIHFRFLSHRGMLGAAMAAMLLSSGCAQRTMPLNIDTSHVSVNQDSRVLYLVLHYTQGNFERSLSQLTTVVPGRPPVSAHYLVRDDPVQIYQLVDEQQRAWHAGVSDWKGASLLNASSIGIEIVNPGPRRLPEEPGDQDFAPYPEAQIEQVIALCRAIVIRHHIRPDRILGHSDIQPQTKQDPGPAFPWRRLAEAGLMLWPDEQQVKTRTTAYEAAALPDIGWFQDRLIQFGFKLDRSGVLDHATRRVMSAFQMKYRPARYDGLPDAETAALLEVVNMPEGMKRLAPAPWP